MSIAGQKAPPPRGRLVIVSNRLPLVISGNAEEGWIVKPGTGGLVSALAPLLRDRGEIRQFAREQHRACDLQRRAVDPDQQYASARLGPAAARHRQDRHENATRQPFVGSQHSHRSTFILGEQWLG